MIPKPNKQYYFFDDGKIYLSRCYKASVCKIISTKDTDNCIIVHNDKSYNLINVLKENVDSCRQSENFTVLNAPSLEIGSPWLYAEETDYFIGCLIPNYDDNIVWFTRDVNGGWYSLQIDDLSDTGRLDVDFSLHKQMKKLYKEDMDIDIDESLKEDEMYIDEN